MPSYPVEGLKLDTIRTDGGTQARVGLDESTVERYMETPDDLPPGIVYRDEAGVNWLADGHHCHAARSRLGRDTMAVQVRPGSQRDAVAHAIGANADHGLPRSNADRRNAVTMLLDDPEWGKLSTEQLARMAKVSHYLANEVRKAWEAEHGRQETRTGADGRERPAPETDYSRTPKAQPTAEPSPAREADQDDSPAPTPQPLAREVESASDAPAPPQPPAREVSGPVIDVPDRVVTDAFDVPVPEHLRPVWRTAADIKAIRSALGKAKRDAAAIVGERGAEKYTAASNNTFGNNIDVALEMLSKAEPFVVCPECDGDCCDGGNNSLCEGRGWIHRARYAALSVNLQRKCMRFKGKAA
jgi:hypothetical protein